MNDSSSTIARNTFGWSFLDDRCGESKYGTQLGGKFGNGAILESPVIKIGADEPFFFTAVYIDGRMGQVRQCNLSAQFLPKSGRRYQATLITQGNVASCKLGIFDVTTSAAERVDFSMPANACVLGARAQPNGEPIWTNVNAKVTR